MYRDLWGTYPLHAVSETMNSLDQLDWSGASTPGVWVHTPAFIRNPFQAMLTSRMLEHNLLSVPSTTVANAVELRRKLPAEIPVALHIHWTHPVLHGIHDITQARKALSAYLATVQTAKDSGVHIVWTVHNAMPHDVLHEELEAELQRKLLDITDLVHVMSPRTRELCQPWFTCDESKVLSIPHPSYHGVYPDWIGRKNARRQLGLREGETVFLMFGAIKPYKGLTESIDAINALAVEEPVRLVVAGKADKSAETDAFTNAALTNPAVIIRPEHIDPQEVQVYFRAADIALLPYRRTLNSGALALALTFGLPVVMPSDSGSLPLLSPEFSETFDAGDSSSLLGALRRSLRLVSPDARAAASQAAEAIRLSKVADDFGRAAQEWIAGRTQ